MLFPSDEEVLQIIMKELGNRNMAFRVTDDESALNNAYGVPSGCWYAIYPPGNSKVSNLTSCYIAISKVDGSIVRKGVINHEPILPKPKRSNHESSILY